MRAALILALLLSTAPAAQYEGEGVARALTAEGLTRAAGAEGQTIVEIRALRAPVFIEEEWIPTWLNHLHALTRAPIIRRELLLAKGQPYTEAAAAESARNLRALNVFTFVAVVPYEAAGGVGVAVITRDLWSLRLETAFQFTDGVVDNLNVRLTERNLFGRAQMASVGFTRGAFTDGINELYRDNRLLGRRLRLRESANVIFRRSDGGFDGFNASLRLERPFYNLEQRWGFSIPLTYMDQNARHTAGSILLTWDNPETEAEEAIPRAWRQKLISAALLSKHQLPGRYTRRISYGVGYSDFVLEAGDEVPAAHRAAFERWVLGPDTRQVYPMISGVLFERRYRVYSDLASFGVSEEVRLGPTIVTSASLPLEMLGGNEDALALGASLAWAEAPWGGVAEAAVGAEARLVEAGWVNQRILLRGRGASPKSIIGRLVLRADWRGREAERGSRVVSLGGNNGLRGYPSDAFWDVNAHRIRANAEWRSPPLAWSFIHVGVAAFYDSGAIYKRLEDLHWRQAVGGGLRILLPQFNRSVFRFDVGAPLEGGYAVIWSFGDSQMVPMPGREDGFFSEDESIGGLIDQP